MIFIQKLVRQSAEVNETVLEDSGSMLMLNSLSQLRKL